MLGLSKKKRKKERTIMLENSMKFNPQGLQLFMGNSIMT